VTGWVGALPFDHPVATFHELCLFLGGSPDSFTGGLLTLIGKADPDNLPRLRLGFPAAVAAWQIWRQRAPLTARELYDAVHCVTPDIERFYRAATKE
jgi:hypothetical protein